MSLWWLSATKTLIELHTQRTIRMFLSFFVLAANSWIKYKSDHQVSRRPENERLHYCEFDLLLVKEMNALVQGGHCQQVDKVVTNDEE